ncbi:uncharacterized protein [Procambarus clarkii]|uniref:uncharacterized protein n=1 Tax=Procambarus clarkii TaxID=6728 RepID=UPI001E6784E9|nr:uncharacterized protein LOC123768859 [Procambarus clarkii]
MKSFVVLAVVCLAALASATGDEDPKETPRFGFISLDNTGAVLTLNSTSLQYAVIAGIIVLVFALVIIPILGFDIAKHFATRDGYDHFNYYNEQPEYSSYTSYAKRSLDVLTPVLAALREAYKKYE